MFFNCTNLVVDRAVVICCEQKSAFFYLVEKVPFQQKACWTSVLEKLSLSAFNGPDL